MIFILPAWNGQMMQISAQVLNRHQDNLDLLFIDGTTGTSK
jgi:dipeptidyl-peptidase-4